MEVSTLKELEERCRRLAAQADRFTKQRLLDLAARYDEEIASEANRLSFKRTASLYEGVPKFQAFNAESLPRRRLATGSPSGLFSHPAANALAQLKS